MEITAIKTRPIVVGDNLYTILDTYLPSLKEKDIVVVTSKIVSICEGRVLKNDGSNDKYDLIKKESDRYIRTHEMDKYHIMMTIKRDMLVASAGIDESNGNGYYILWPKDPDQSADQIWSYLRKKHSVVHLGVIITDSRTTPLRWGTIGFGISWCGFDALKSYVGKPDCFGRKLRYQRASIVDGLSAASALCMGEGNEQTPLALIRNTPMVHFQDKPPTKNDRNTLRINLRDDIYAPFLTSVPWKKGGRSRK